MPTEIIYLLLAAAAMLIIVGGISFASRNFTLGNIKSKTVGDGQHGTARFATPKEIRQTYLRIPFLPKYWRQGQSLPSTQGIIVGSECARSRAGKKNKITALVDSGDVHVLMIAASGAGKTAYFLYPNLEYACACGMSFLCTDTKSDLYRNYAGVAKDQYGYRVAVIDLRNPTRSDGYNFLHLVNRYMDIARNDPTNLAARAKAEKYAKIISKTIISASGDSSVHGQNAFFYDAAEGLLTSVILLMAEHLPNEGGTEKRHIVSAYKLVQDLLAPAPQTNEKEKPKSRFQVLMEKLPAEHKARWFAGAALNSSEQAMASVMSTLLSRLNAFIDSELEQMLCFDTAISAETFCTEKSAVFIVLPEEDPGKYFLVSLFIQQFYREILSIADEQGGKLKNRVVFYCDELGTIPPIQSLELIFSASRSRGLLMVPIIQGLGQLRKNYGADGASIIIDNCQDVIAGCFAPTSETADTLSKALGSRTILSGSVSSGGGAAAGKSNPSQTLQMMERPLMTSDELKAMPRGHFIVMKTGVHAMRTRLRLFLEWGITFGEPYELPERAARPVCYADAQELERAVVAKDMERNTCHGNAAKPGNANHAGRGMMDTQQQHPATRHGRRSAEQAAKYAYKED